MDVVPVGDVLYARGIGAGRSLHFSAARVGYPGYGSPIAADNGHRSHHHERCRYGMHDCARGIRAQGLALCVDSSRKAILWYETDILSGTLHMISRVTFAKSQRDVDIEAERFIFTRRRQVRPLHRAGSIVS